jgi:hypothetical protein
MAELDALITRYGPRFSSADPVTAAVALTPDIGTVTVPSDLLAGVAGDGLRVRGGSDDGS